jgi:Cu+-exporting ATPase
MLQGFSFNSMKKSILKTLIIFERLENSNFHFVIFVYGDGLLLLPMLAGLVGVQFQLPVIWQFLLASIVQFGLGWRFYRGAWAALRVGSSNMDVLVALGTTAAYGLSLYQWLLQPHHAHLYFESSATVITLVWFG